MSRYRIVITELAPNPNYDPERAVYRNVDPEVERNVLTFIATDEQFAAIRKAALEAM